MEFANCPVRLALALRNYTEPNFSKFIQMSFCKYYNIINYIDEIFGKVCNY